MASNKIIRIGPVALTNAAANYLNPGTTTGGVGAGTPQNTYMIIKHVTIVNKTAGAVTVSMYIGATAGSAAGTEFLFNAYSIPANSYVERYCQTALEVADFLTALASANTSLTLEIDVEVGIR